MSDGLDILVVEDEVIVSEEITECLQSFGYRVVGQAVSALEALQHLEKYQIDVALLDISIKGNMDGIELATKLREKFNCAIIFLTAHSDDAMLERAKKVRPEAYLVKPFDRRNLYTAINLAFENFNQWMLLRDQIQTQRVKDRIFLKQGQKYEKVFISDILFIEADRSYSTVVTAIGTYTYSFNLSEAIDRIVHPDLMRAHRSYLVNIKNIDSIDGNQLILGSHKIQMSQSYRDEIIHRLNLI